MVSKSVVAVVIGPEWALVRALVSDRIAEFLPGTSVPTCVATLDATESSPTGRVANWIALALSAHPAACTVVVPGGPPVKSELINGSRWISITELLLDPDPAQAEQLYAVGIWTRFVGRRERLKLRVSPTLPYDIAGNAVRFSPALSVLVGEWRGQRLVIVGTDLISIEVTARTFRAVAQPAGDIGLSPWQAPIVQAAIERSMGVTNGSQISLCVQFGEPIAPFVRAQATELARRIASAIDTPFLVQ